MAAKAANTVPADEHVVEVADDVVGVGHLPVPGTTASVTPVSPPMVNSAMKPQAKSSGVVKRKAPPHMVASQLKIFTPVGMAMSMLVAGEDGVEERPQPDREHVVGPDRESEEADDARA